MVEIRPATALDMGAVLGMLRRFHAASGWSAPYDPVHLSVTVSDRIRNGFAHVLVQDGRCDGVLLGRAFVHPLAPITVAAETAWWVNEGRRGRGMLLLDAFEAWADEQNAGMIWMGSRTPALTRLLQRRGFTVAEAGLIRMVG